MRRAAFALLLCAACRAAPTPPPFAELSARAAGDGVHVTLLPHAGVRVSALVPPALELGDGTVLRFDGPLDPADSTYHLGPLAAVAAPGMSRLRGTLRASACYEGERVCRVFRQAVSLAVGER